MIDRGGRCEKEEMNVSVAAMAWWSAREGRRLAITLHVFVDSSPIPSARNRAQKVVEDQANATTPAASRKLKLHDAEEVGSSPPHLEKETVLTAMDQEDDVHITVLLEYPCA